MSIEFLAAASLAGISPKQFLHADSDEETLLLTLVADKAIEFQKLQQRNLAAQIINFLGQALNDKKQSRAVQRNN